LRFWAAKKQSQFKPNLFSPQIYLGVEDWIEKTNPIYGRAKMAQALY